MTWLHQISHTKPFATTAIALVVSIGVLGMRQQGWLERLELRAYDRFLQFGAPRSVSESQVVLICIYETDIQHYGFPIPDGILARAVEQLVAMEAAAIGVDIFRDIPNSGRDQLSYAVRGDPRIVMIDKRVGEEGVSSPEFLDGAEQVGFADLKQDFGRTIRRGLLILWDAADPARHALSFSLQLALRYLETRGITLNPDPSNAMNLRIGATPFPRFQSNDGGYRSADDGGYQYLMDYGYGENPFTSYSLTDVINGKIDPEAINDQIVIIGTTSGSVRDRHETPFTSAGAVSMHGVEIHGHAVDQLVRAGLQGDSPIKSLSEFHEINWVLFVSLAGAVLGVVVRSLWGVIAVAAGSLTVLFIAGGLFFRFGWWLPVAAPSLAWLGSFAGAVVYISILEHSELTQITALFGKYVSRDVAADLWNKRDQFLDDGRPRPERFTVTVMMTDLKDYTSAVEKMDPAETMDWINSYMSVMTGIVEDHGGIVEDYAGDGLKASFGVPVPRSNEQEIDNDAVNAAHCALAMGKALSELNARWKEQGFPLERLRIGICTGPVLAGSVGSDQRMAYTTVGDTVNAAARLESFDKTSFEEESTGSFRILIGESTWRRLGNQFSGEFIGEHSIRGREQAMSIYRVFGTHVIKV